MTALTDDEPVKPRMTVNLDGYFDERNGIRYLGRATLFRSGAWRVLADVCGMLAVVEVRISRLRQSKENEQILREILADGAPKGGCLGRRY